METHQSAQTPDAAAPLELKYALTDGANRGRRTMGRLRLSTNLLAVPVIIATIPVIIFMRELFRNGDLFDRPEIANLCASLVGIAFCMVTLFIATTIVRKLLEKSAKAHLHGDALPPRIASDFRVPEASVRQALEAIITNHSEAGKFTHGASLISMEIMKDDRSGTTTEYLRVRQEDATATSDEIIVVQ